MTENQRDQGVGVTLKAGTGYDAPWITFKGTVEQVHSDIVAAFGSEGLVDLNTPLVDAVVEAAKAFSAQYATGTVLGGRPVRGSGGAQKGSEDKGGTSTQEAPAKPAEEPQEAAEPLPIADAITACASVAELKDLWAERSAEISPSPELVAAFKARGTELKTN